MWNKTLGYVNNLINNITLSSNEDNRLQTFIKLQHMHIGKNTFKVSESDCYVENYADCAFHNEIILQLR